MMVKQGRWAALGASVLLVSACSSSDMTQADKNTICPIIGGALGTALGGGGVVAGGMIGGMVCDQGSAEVIVVDTDGDGVADGLDACPNTEAGFPVDERGCALDSDSDGVADGIDDCPDTPAGAAVDAAGCTLPVVMRETCNEFVKIVDDQVVSFEPLYFNFDKYDLTAREEEKAACYTEVLAENAISVDLVGHTDNSGTQAYNLELSQKRAQDAYEVFIAEGANAANLSHMGVGETQPVANNDTEEGRQLNRRVEILVD